MLTDACLPVGLGAEETGALEGVLSVFEGIEESEETAGDVILNGTDGILLSDEVFFDDALCEVTAVSDEALFSDEVSGTDSCEASDMSEVSVLSFGIKV